MKEKNSLDMIFMRILMKPIAFVCLFCWWLYVVFDCILTDNKFFDRIKVDYKAMWEIIIMNPIQH